MLDIQNCLTLWQYFYFAKEILMWTFLTASLNVQESLIQDIHLVQQLQFFMLQGINGIHWQRIHATSAWRNGPPRYDCVFVENDPTLPGFQGLYVAQVLLFFSFNF